MQYLYAAYFSPVKSTFEQAIKKYHFKIWPGLTSDILKHLPKTVAMVQGHMYQEQQHLQSPKPNSQNQTSMDAIWAHLKRLKAKEKPGQSIEDVLKEEISEDSFPVSPSHNTKTNDVAYMIVNKKELSAAYTDLTGRFPCKSNRGNQYVLVGYHYDGNCIIRKH